MGETSEGTCVLTVGLDASAADPLLDLGSGSVAGQQSLLDEEEGSAWNLGLGS